MQGNPILQPLMRLSPDERRRELFAASAGRRSYGEVCEGMLGYAGWLIGAEGVRPGDRVAICLPKSLETAQLVYGILAAGAVYVPLHYQGPPERLARMLASLRPALLIATAQMAAMIRSAGGEHASRVIETGHDEDALPALRRGIPPARVIAAVSPADLASVTFTSGSTGEPKGVMWSQRGMEAAIRSVAKGRGMTSSDRLISLTGLHYTSSSDILAPVMSLASVYLCGDRESLADRQAEIAESERTTLWASSATTLRHLVEGGSLKRRDLRSLRLVSFFGEPMPIPLLREAMAALPDTQFRNLYGATEAFSMAEYPVPRPLGADVGMLPLGRPTANYALSLRDEAGREVGPGEIGEICVVGTAVTIGYWNDPALSLAKRLAEVPDSYRTGDLGRRDAEGLIWSAGRMDHQVKLRGHRFDLGEIEAVARSVPGVREAVAIVIDPAAQTPEILLAVLSDAGGDRAAALEQALKRISQKSLPRYARPTRIAIRAEFPLLSSGKIDRRALKALVAPG
jgi:mycobactin phenyloxazoline synthetase